MAKSNVYLNFDGNCAEAMKFYQEALGGELELQPIGTSAMAEHMPTADPNSILHSMLTSGGITIMASDMMQSVKAENGNMYSICLVCESEEEINRHFNKLSQGGQIIEKLATAPWGATFGMLKDKFGKNWMFNFTHMG